MVGETPKMTKSGRPRQRSPRHWYERQKIFVRKLQGGKRKIKEEPKEKK